MFTGAAANELGDLMRSQAAYQKAIEISADQTPAWQGLAQLYEKQASTSELASVYYELRKLFANDANKHFDFSLKYANTLFSQAKYKLAIDVYVSLLKSKLKEKDYSPVVENLTRLLTDSTLVTDQVDYLRRI